MGGSSPSNVKQTTTTEPPKYIQPYATSMLSGGAQIANQPYNPYPGLSMAPLAPEQQAGMYMQTQRALQGSPLVSAAQQSMQDMASGAGMDYGQGIANNPLGMQIASRVNPLGTNALLGLENPYLNAAIGQAQGDVLNAFNFNTAPYLGYLDRESGSYGNSGQQQLQMQAQRQVLDQLGNISTDMRMQDYGLQAQLGESDIARRAAAFEAQKAAESGAFQFNQSAMLDAWNNERNRMLQASQLAPTLAAQDYIDAQALMGAGDARQAYQQQLLDAASGQWAAAQSYPYSQYDWFANLLRGAGFGTYGQSVSSSPNPYQSNSLANIMGGGLAAYGLADAMNLFG